MKDTSPYKLALRQNVADAFDTRFTGMNFAKGLYRVLNILKVEQQLEAHMRALRKIDMQAVERQLAEQYKRYVESLQTGHGQAGSMVNHYFRVMGKHALGTVPCWYKFNVPYKVTVRFLRFRLGCHYLRLNTGRWGHPEVAVRDRKCIRCGQTFQRPHDVPVDDETHCLINCQEPVMVYHRRGLEAALRDSHAHPATNSVQQLFGAVEETGNTDLQRQLLLFVAKCFRVAEQCHKDLAGWQSGREVSTVMELEQRQLQMHQLGAEQEARYVAGEFDSLSSATTMEEGSELLPASDVGPWQDEQADEVVSS
jgi:hypothetical protein